MARRVIIQVALLYGVIAALICAPVLPAPTRLALGHAGTDTWNHVWGYGHLADALAAGDLPMVVTRLRWPDGGQLWFIDSFNALLAVPITWVIGPIASYNLMIWANFTLCGVGACALAFRLSSRLPGALLAGLIYQVSPHLLGQAYNGISETLSAGWLPLSLLMLVNLLDRPTPRQGAAWGLLLAIAALANWYYGLFAVFITAAWLLNTACLTPRRLWKARRALGVGGGIFGLILVPALAVFRATLTGADALVQREADFVWRTLVGHNMVDLLAFFVPIRSPDLKALFDEELVVIVYLGLVPLTLAAVGVLQRTRARRWGVGALVAFSLALGPYLYIDGAYLMLGQQRIPLPFLVIFELLPRISHAYRAVVPLTLCLAVIAALVLAKTRRPWSVAIGLGLAHLSEVVLVSPAILPLPTPQADVPAVYARLHALPDGAVLDLPVSVQVLDRGGRFQAQMQHQRPIPYALNDPTPEALRNNPLTRTLIALERTPTTLLPARIPALAIEQGRQALLDDGYAAIIVHHTEYPNGHDRSTLDLLTDLFGPGERIGAATLFTLQ